MNDLPTSTETNTSPLNESADLLPDPTENPEAASILSGVADMPEIDPDQYFEEQERAQKRARMIGKFILGFIPVIAIFVFLRMTGHLSRSSLSSVIHGKSETQATPAPSNPTNFSVGSHTNDSKTMPDQQNVVVTKKDPAVAKDLHDYVYRDLLNVHADETVALTTFAKVTGPNFHSRQETYQTLKDTIIPAYGRFLAKANAIHPKTPAVKMLHRYFVDSATVKMLAFQHMLEDQDVPDNLWQIGVKAEFGGSEQLGNQFKTMAGQLAQQQGVKLP